MKRRATDFRAGWNAAVGAGTSILGAARADDWLRGVQDAIDTANQNLSNVGQQYAGLGEHFLKGHLAESWHEGTFNIDAALNRSEARATRFGLNGDGSPDLRVSGRFGDHEVQVKFYRSAEDTAKAISRPEYGAMGKVVPQDQVEGVRERAAHLADWNRVRRPDQAAEYDHTAEVAAGRVEYDGNASRGLDEREALRLAREAKRDGVDGAQHGLTMADTVDWEHVAGEALTAGAITAAIGGAASAAPHVARALRAAIRKGEIDLDALREGGRAALVGGAAGGLRGAVAAGIVSAARTGALGEAMTNVSPGAVGAVVAASLSVMADTCSLAQGELDVTEYGKRITITSVTSAAAYGGSVVGQAVIPVPVVGAMIGGIIGSALGSAGVAGASVALERLDDPVVAEAHVDIARGVGEIAGAVAHGIVRLDELARRRAAFEANLVPMLVAWEAVRRRAADHSEAAAKFHDEALALADDHDVRLTKLLSGSEAS